MTDVTRAWAILEHFRRNWIEPIWLGCDMERYEAIRSADDLLAWLEEKPEHANSDLGLFWRMSRDIGLDTYGGGAGKYLSWGYMPHEDTYNHPTIEGRAGAVIRKGGIYDGIADLHRPVDQAATREDTTHAWYDEGGAVHPFDRLTTPSDHNAPDFERPLFLVDRGAACRARPAGDRCTGAPAHRRRPAWREVAAHRSAGARHVPQVWRRQRHAAPFRAHARTGRRIYREAERALREFRLNDPWYIKPTERDGRGWGATEAARGALCHWIDIEGGRIRNYQIVAPTTWNVGPRDAAGVRGPIEAGADRHADRRSARPGRGRACMPVLRFLPGLHRPRP